MIEGIVTRENYEAAKVMLDNSVLRHKAIAANVANVETPGYKRVDLDPKFDERLTRILQTGNSGELASFEHRLHVDKKSASVRPDGNNVKIDRELLAMNRNAMEYEFLTQYLTRSYSKIKTAITGTVR